MREDKVRGGSLAKTTRPSASNVLPRERLFAALDAGRRASLLWVHGPPGCGKTALVSSYLEARPSAGLWYQMDAGDSDPAALCLYLGESMHGEHPGAGRRLPLFTSEYQSDPGAFARHYFRSLYQALEPPFLLVFDNYQELGEDSAVHDMLREALVELPADGCVAVLSRTPPPSAFIRLRANREMVVLDWESLRLSREESDAIVRSHAPLADDALLDAIYQRTDGWAAALILALQQGNGGAAGLPESDAAPQLLFDYLAGEVFAGFEPAVRELLTRTAFLEEMSVDAATALSGEARAGALLDRVNRAHQMLTVKPGPHGPVYACHPLLREYLLAHARSVLSSEDRVRLVERAAELLEQGGAADAAMRLLAEHDREQALARMLLRNAGAMLVQGRTRTLEHWLRWIPEARRLREPWLIYWLGACRFQSDPGAARPLLEQAHAAFEAHRPDDRDGLALSAAHAMHATILALDDFSVLDRWFEHAEALADETGLGPEPRARLAVSLFMGLVFRQPHHPRMGDWAERALAAARTLGDAHLRLSTQLLVAINLNYTGQFLRVAEFLQAMRLQAQGPDAQPLERTTLKAVESMLHMLNADAEPCLKSVFDGLEIADETGVQLWSYHLLSNGVAGALGAGDLDTAADLLERMQDYAHGARRLDRSGYHYYRAWHAMLCRDVDGAWREARQALALAEEVGCPFYVVLCRIALAQVLVARGEWKRAAAQLRRVRSVARRIKNRLLEYTALLALAHMALAGGRRRVAVLALRRGLEVGREHGFKHCLWWLPEALSSICAVALEEGIEVDYVQWLVLERGLRPPSPAVHADWPWPVEIVTLGGFRVSVRGGASVPRLSGKPLALLKALVGLGGRVEESVLAALLWPRIDADYARRSLTTTLHRLRKLLGEDGALVLRHGRLSLAPHLCRVDVDAMAAVLDAIQSTDRGAAGPGWLSEQAGLLLALYSGPFMEGEDDDVHKPLRERLRNQLLGALDTLARASEDAGEPDLGVEFYRRAIDRDPQEQGLHRRLMLMLRDLGRPAEAVEAYARCRSLLDAAGGLEPSPETRAIYEMVSRDL